MSRTAKFLKNSASTALMQAVTMFVGFFIPRIMMGVYGSEINGLISSISQFIAYFNLVETGIAGAAVWALYKPLAEHNNKVINSIIVATKNFYTKAGYVFVTLTLGLAFLYPAFIKVETLDYVEVICLVIILGVAGALEFFTLAKYRALLTADQKTYVISIASTIAIILNAVIIAVLSYQNINVVIVRAVALLSVFARSILLWFYCKKKYTYICYEVEPDYSKLHKHWDAMFLQILGVVQSGGPIVLATIFTDLKMVSVYTVFNLVIGGINSILSIFISGLSSSFGDVIARNEVSTLKRAYNEFEISYYMLITVVYSISFIMIMPFIHIYTRNITDVNYDLPILGFLMVLNGLLYNIKTPQGMLVISAGWYKETRKQTILQATILLVCGGLGAHYCGLYGIVIGAIISNLYRDVDLAVFIPKRLIKINPLKTFVRIGFIFLLAFIICFPFYYLQIPAGNIISWCMYAFGVSIYAITVVIIFMIIVERGILNNILNRVCKLRNM